MGKTVSCPTLFYGWVGIGAYAKMVLKGHLSSSLHLACVWDVYSRMLWVGKVGLKDGLKWPSSAKGPSPLGSMGPRAGQVKIRTNYKIGQSVLCHSAKSTPTTCTPNKTPTTRNNGQVEPAEANDKAVSSVASSSATKPPSSTGAAPVSSYGTSPKGTKGSPSSTGSIASPHVTRSPTFSI